MVTKMKKLLSVLLLIIAFSSLSACGKQGNSQPVSDDPTNGINNGLKSNEYGDTVTDYGTQAYEKTSFEIGKDDQPFFISKTGMNISIHYIIMITKYKKLLSLAENPTVST